MKCVNCNETMEWDGKGRKPKYCSDRCKVAFHRKGRVKEGGPLDGSERVEKGGNGCKSVEKAVGPELAAAGVNRGVDRFGAPLGPGEKMVPYHIAVYMPEVPLRLVGLPYPGEVTLALPHSFPGSEGNAEKEVLVEKVGREEDLEPFA